ncbi:glutathione-disulfide reductase [Vaginisenegalia massiliensis]|uniref:glutathione-disulfide reductase n=1 Tax=Vaginisenegalia massiliensis TaxID=2058294 RepID=UPI000F53D374|nr:glutathione-disulfide reductase [Vaginisenegalia massiliensis]
MKEYDLITIGGGSGGIAAANRAAEYGAKVAVIEAKQIGGTCVNLGCVPKKIGWYAAGINQAIEHYGPGYGFEVQDKSFDYGQFLKARQAYIERSRQAYLQRFNKNDIDLIEGFATFKSDHIVQVNGEDLYGRHIIIATGGRAIKPDIPGAQWCETSDDFFAWQKLPKSVAIVGAGYIALELANLLNDFGVETHLLIRHDRPLRQFDALLGQEWMHAAKASGIHLHSHVRIDEVKRDEVSQQLVCYQDNQAIVQVERVIMAVGRQANTQQLKLETTQIKVNKEGTIQVDEGHQTHANGVYAIGDVIGKLDLTPVAIRAGRQLAEYLFNQAPSSKIDYDNVPTVIFSHPPMGSIGLSQEQAEERYGQGQIKVYQAKFYSMYASAAFHREACVFKLICQGPNERIVGLHAIGHGVDEMIQGFAVAIKMGATKPDFDATVAIHPTGSEEFVTMR